MGDITQKNLEFYSGRGLTLVSEYVMSEQDYATHRSGDSSDHFDYKSALSIDQRAYMDEAEWETPSDFKQISVDYDLLEGEERNEAVIDLLLNYHRYTYLRIYSYFAKAEHEESRRDKRGETVMSSETSEHNLYIFKCIHVDSFDAIIYDGTVNLRAAVRMCSLDELHDYMDDFEGSQEMSFYRYYANEVCVEDEGGEAVIGYTGEWRQSQLIAENSYTE